MSEFESGTATAGSLDPALCHKARRVVAAMSADAKECAALLSMLGIADLPAAERVGARRSSKGDAA